MVCGGEALGVLVADVQAAEVFDELPGGDFEAGVVERRGMYR